MMKSGANFFFTLMIAAGISMLSISCGEIMPGADPDPVEKTVRFEVDGSVDKADILTRDDSGELMHGEEESDGTVKPETVDLPWEYEYEIDGNQANYFYLEASNSDRNAKASGSVDTWEENYLDDTGASFTSTVVPGYILYNTTDAVFREVIEVVDDTRLSLSSCPYPYSEREYIIFRYDGISGTVTSPATDKLIDTGADFVDDGVTAGNIVENTTTHDFAVITGVDAGGEELSLNSDIFQSKQGYKIYSIKLQASCSTKYVTPAPDLGVLFDSSASSLSTVTTGDAVQNTAAGTFATISTIVSDNQLILSSNIFPPRNMQYTIYKKRSLTCTVYVDDEEFDTTTSSHWDTVEAALSGTIPAEGDE